MSSSFKDLNVWKKSMELVESIYLLCKKLPQTEEYQISSQLRRCATSIPANIAEGRGRYTRKEFRRYLFIARGSSYELETFLLLVELIYKVDTTPEQVTTTEIQRMISGLISSIKI